MISEEGANLAKIIATLGPASSAKSVMREMVEAGLDAARINFSHGTAEANLELITAMRRVAKDQGRTVAIIQDLQGHKLRVGLLPPGGVTLREESLVTLVCGAEQTEGDAIPVPNERLPLALKRDDHILLHDGQLELIVMKVEGRRIITRVLLGGVLKSQRGLAAPNATGLHEGSLTEKDKQDLAFGLKHGVDFVAQSFVRSADDIDQLRLLMHELMPDSPLPGIIAKIENHAALENFDGILAAADGIMIARGDLGVETSVSSLPVTQKEIIGKCVVAGKPVVVATQLLASMVQQPRPTRAEASDVANAVLDHADAVMLSDETAVGRFPVRSVEQMADIIRQTEAAPIKGLMPTVDSRGESVPQAVASAAVQLARHVEAAAILVVTKSGYSARAVARFRWEVPIFAASEDPQVVRQLALSWGVTPLLVDGYDQPVEMSRSALEILRADHGVDAGAPVVVVSGLQDSQGGYDSMVRVVEA